MTNRQTLLVVSVALALLVSPTIMAQETATATRNTTNESGETAGMGPQVTAFTQSSAAAVNDSVENGMWQAGFNRSNASDRAELVRNRTGTLERRLERLQRQNRSLRQRYENGSLPQPAYIAQQSRLSTRIDTLRTAINDTDEAATQAGVDDSRLDRLRENASELRGPEVAAIARGLGGGPPEDAGPPGNDSDDRGPPEDAGPPGNDSDDRGPPEDAGQSGDDDTGPPEDAGQSDDDDSGPPDDAGQSDDDDTGPPDDAGQSDDDDTGPPEDAGQSGDGDSGPPEDAGESDQPVNRGDSEDGSTGGGNQSDATAGNSDSGGGAGGNADDSDSGSDGESSNADDNGAESGGNSGNSDSSGGGSGNPNDSGSSDDTDDSPGNGGQGSGGPP